MKLLFIFIGLFLQSKGDLWRGAENTEVYLKAEENNVFFLGSMDDEFSSILGFCEHLASSCFLRSLSPLHPVKNTFEKDGLRTSVKAWMVKMMKTPHYLVEEENVCSNKMIEYDSIVLVYKYLQSPLIIHFHHDFGAICVDTVKDDDEKPLCHYFDMSNCMQEGFIDVLKSEKLEYVRIMTMEDWDKQKDSYLFFRRQ